MSGFASNDAATASSTTYESRVNADRLVSKLTPRSTSVGRGGAPGTAARTDSGANRMRQPLASTGAPGGAGGGGVRGRAGGGGGAVARPVARGGGLGGGAIASCTRSPSGWVGQPLASTVAPAGVLGH